MDNCLENPLAPFNVSELRAFPPLYFSHKRETSLRGRRKKGRVRGEGEKLSRRCISVANEKLACVAGERGGGGGEREKSAKAGKREWSPSPLSPFPLSFPFLPIPVLTPATQDSEKHAKQLVSITS